MTAIARSVFLPSQEKHPTTSISAVCATAGSIFFLAIAREAHVAENPCPLREPSISLTPYLKPSAIEAHIENLTLASVPSTIVIRLRTIAREAHGENLTFASAHREKHTLRISPFAQPIGREAHVENLALCLSPSTIDISLYSISTIAICLYSIPTPSLLSPSVSASPEKHTSESLPCCLGTASFTRLKVMLLSHRCNMADANMADANTTTLRAMLTQWKPEMLCTTAELMNHKNSLWPKFDAGTIKHWDAFNLATLDESYGHILDCPVPAELLAEVPRTDHLETVAVGSQKDALRFLIQWHDGLLRPTLALVRQQLDLDTDVKHEVDLFAPGPPAMGAVRPSPRARGRVLPAADSGRRPRPLERPVLQSPSGRPSPSCPQGAHLAAT